MGHEKLRNLAILSIGHSKTRNVNFDVVINTFAEQKARKKELIEFFNRYFKAWKIIANREMLNDVSSAAKRFLYDFI